MKALLCVLILTALCFAADPEASPAGAPPQITVDVSAEPEWKDYAERLRVIAVEWYPKIVETLDGKDAPLQGPVKLVFRRGVTQIAATAGNTIYFEPKWFEQHPADLGVVVHELVHVIQQYPRGSPGWVVEGLADYIRWVVYEPKNFRPPLHEKSKHTDSYQTTGAFFGWVEGRHPGTMKKLNGACRAGQYSDGLFTELTGSDLTTLWDTFIREVVTKPVSNG